MENLDPKECREKRIQKNNFLKEITDYRGDLFKYCRKLTNNPWDAEDLVQETLVLAYGKLADKHAGIKNVRSYLFKMATNQWIDWSRRSKVQFNSELVPDQPYYMNNYYEVKDTLSSIYFLPPKERVAFVLSEAFDSKNDEIAEILGTSEGAVKSALSRGREKLKIIAAGKTLEQKNRTTSEQEKIVNLAVDAFNRRDLEAFSTLFISNAVGNAPGCFFETNLEEIRKGSLFHTINSHDGSPLPLEYKAEMVNINGDIMFVIFNGETLDDVWRFTVDDQKIERFDCYYCCPDVLSEIAGRIGKKSNDHGYYFEQNL